MLLSRNSICMLSVFLVCCNGSKSPWNVHTWWLYPQIVAYIGILGIAIYGSSNMSVIWPRHAIVLPSCPRTPNLVLLRNALVSPAHDGWGYPKYINLYIILYNQYQNTFRRRPTIPTIVSGIISGIFYGCNDTLQKMTSDAWLDSTSRSLV